MPLDADTKAVLDLLESLGAPELSTLTPSAARELTFAAPPAEPTAVASIENVTVPTADCDIPVRIYRSADSAAVLVYYHGGGWVIGDLESHDEVCRTLANKAGINVVSVDYRLAPEHPFPAPLDDCYNATAWVADNAQALGFDANRIAVGGDSAGGNLAAAVAIKARDNNGPKIAFQLLVYPVTNARFDTPSYEANAEGYMLTKKSMQWFWQHYTGEANPDHPLASVLQTDNLSGLPPALVQTAEYDPLCDEGEAYATALEEAGVTVTCTRYDGTIHGFFSMSATISQARAAVAEAVEHLNKHI